jgi:hydrogenase nickel incorporation protein HypA/HybF
MHEIGIIQDILHILEDKYKDKIVDIKKVEIEAGLLCNVQPILIQNAYEAVIASESKYSNIELDVKLLPIIAFCQKCEENFEVMRHKFVCKCGEPSRTIVQGEELRISRIDF